MGFVCLLESLAYFGEAGGGGGGAGRQASPGSGAGSLFLS